MPRASEYRSRVYRWGDWKKARSIFGGLAFRMQKAVEQGVWEEVQAAERRIKKNIFEQNYPHLPLSEWQANKKEREGKDPRILIEDGSYVRAIKAMHLGRGTYGVGIPSDDQENAAKGHLHEWGGTNNLGRFVPARPHYRIELERIRNGRLQRLSHYMNQALQGKDFVSSRGNRIIGVDSVEEARGE